MRKEEKQKSCASSLPTHPARHPAQPQPSPSNRDTYHNIHHGVPRNHSSVSLILNQQPSARPERGGGEEPPPHPTTTTADGSGTPGRPVTRPPNACERTAERSCLRCFFGPKAHAPFLPPSPPPATHLRPRYHRHPPQRTPSSPRETRKSRSTASGRFSPGAVRWGVGRCLACGWRRRALRVIRGRVGSVGGHSSCSVRREQ